MTKRIKRHRDFEVQILLKSDGFLCTPRKDQRDWNLNRVVKEAAEELLALNAHAVRFKKGSSPVSIQDRTQAELDPDEIMENWQIPVMQSMADLVTASHGDILEIGFGRGVASEMIQKRGVRSHTIVECNPHIVENFRKWRTRRPNSDISILEGLWQDVSDRFAQYDGIFFHAYPLNVQDFTEQVMASATFAGSFFPVAAQHLQDGGCFSYFSNEADSLSRAHQRLLLANFSSFTIRQVCNLGIPEDTRDSHWLDEMLVVQAFK